MKPALHDALTLLRATLDEATCNKIRDLLHATPGIGLDEGQLQATFVEPRYGAGYRVVVDEETEDAEGYHPAQIFLTRYSDDVTKLVCKTRGVVFHPDEPLRTRFEFNCNHDEYDDHYNYQDVPWDELAHALTRAVDDRRRVYGRDVG